MAMIDCTTADRDLTSQVQVFTYTNATGQDLVVMGIVSLGDGSKDLDGSGGDFELTLEVSGQTVQPDPQLINFSTAVRAMTFTEQFTLYDGDTVNFKVLSPNAADTDVTVKACLIETGSHDTRVDLDAIIADIATLTSTERTVKNVYGSDKETSEGVIPEISPL
jgi:hypothetical protein